MYRLRELINSNKLKISWKSRTDNKFDKRKFFLVIIKVMEFLFFQQLIKVIFDTIIFTSGLKCNKSTKKTLPIIQRTNKIHTFELDNPIFQHLLFLWRKHDSMVNKVKRPSILRTRQ